MHLHLFEEFTSVADLLDRGTSPLAGKSIDAQSAKWERALPFLTQFTRAVRQDQQGESVLWDYDFAFTHEGLSVRASLTLRVGKRVDFTFDYEEEEAGAENVSKSFARKQVDNTELSRLLKETREYLKNRNKMFKDEQNFSIFVAKSRK